MRLTYKIGAGQSNIGYLCTGEAEKQGVAQSMKLDASAAPTQS